MRFMDKRFKMFLNWFLLIFWMGLIFYLSGRPFLSSGFTAKEDFVLRKIAHISEYAILTFLTWRVFANKKETKFLKGNSVSKIPRELFYAIIFSFLYAVSDEIHQLFVIGRAGKAEDVIIDGVGVLIAAEMIWGKFIKL